jgi:hypothetical protein
VDLRFAAVAVLLLGLVALVVNGVVSAARSSSSYEVLINQSFALQANNVIAAQSVQGSRLSALLVDAPSLSRSGLEQALGSLMTATATSAEQAHLAASPEPSAQAGSKFAALVAQRAEAVSMINHAIRGLLGLRSTPGTTSASALLSTGQATVQLSRAGSMLMTADAQVGPLRRSLVASPGHAQMHRSVFVSEPGLLTARSMALLVSALESSPSMAVVHQLVLTSVSLSPSPLPVGGGAQDITLPPANSLTVTLVIKNKGNAGEAPVRSSASIAPQQGGLPGTSSASSSVSAGGAVSVELAAMRIVPGSTVTLTVSVEPAPGQIDRSGLTQTFRVLVGASSVTTTTLKP